MGDWDRQSPGSRFIEPVHKVPSTALWMKLCAQRAFEDLSVAGWRKFMFYSSASPTLPAVMHLFPACHLLLFSLPQKQHRILQSKFRYITGAFLTCAENYGRDDHLGIMGQTGIVTSSLLIGPSLYLDLMGLQFLNCKLEKTFPDLIAG